MRANRRDLSSLSLPRPTAAGNMGPGRIKPPGADATQRMNIAGVSSALDFGPGSRRGKNITQLDSSTKPAVSGMAAIGRMGGRGGVR